MIILLASMIALGTATLPGPAPAAASAPPPRQPASPARSLVARALVAPRPTRAQVLAAVRSEWPRYDPSGKGRLTPLEFSTWVMRSHGGTVAARSKDRGIAPVSAMNASATAFSRADADHDGGVTPEEMVSFLLPPVPATPARAGNTAARPPATTAKSASAAR